MHSRIALEIITFAIVNFRTFIKLVSFEEEKKRANISSYNRTGTVDGAKFV